MDLIERIQNQPEASAGYAVYGDALITGISRDHPVDDFQAFASSPLVQRAKKHLTLSGMVRPRLVVT